MLFRNYITIKLWRVVIHTFEKVKIRKKMFQSHKYDFSVFILCLIECNQEQVRSNIISGDMADLVEHNIK